MNEPRRNFDRVNEHGGDGPLASGGLSARRAWWSSTPVGRTRRPAQAAPSSRRMVCECRPVASGSASETNGGKVVGRGVVVGEGVDRGEGGLRGVSAAPALGLCLAQGLGSRSCGGRRFPAGGGFAGADVLSAVVRGCRWSCRQPGREGGSEEPPARGVVRIRGRSSMAGGHRVDHRIARAVVQVGSRVAAVSGLPLRR